MKLKQVLTINSVKPKHEIRFWNYEKLIKDTVAQIEPPHDKTNKVTVRPAKTDQTGRSLRCPHEETLGP